MVFIKCYARRDDVAEHALGGKRGLAEQAEGNQHKTRERRQLEFDEGDKKLDRQDEEGQQHHDPGKQQDDDLDEILEEADIAHQGQDEIQDRTAGINTDLGHAAPSRGDRRWTCRSRRLSGQARQNSRRRYARDYSSCR